MTWADTNMADFLSFLFLGLQQDFFPQCSFIYVMAIVK